MGTSTRGLTPVPVAQRNHSLYRSFLSLVETFIIEDGSLSYLSALVYREYLSPLLITLVGTPPATDVLRVRPSRPLSSLLEDTHLPPPTSQHQNRPASSADCCDLSRSRDNDLSVPCSNGYQDLCAAHHQLAISLPSPSERPSSIAASVPFGESVFAQQSNSTAAPAAPSYASAAGAAKKQSSTPVVATGSNAPVVATGSSAPTPQHAKSSSISPMNGRPNIMPAVPSGAPSAPAVAHGTSAVNGHNEHNRKSSVTMSANGPNSFSANGGSVNTAKPGNLQFGFNDSPAASHSTPQLGSAPVPIPTGSNPRVTSPQNSPSPIPQPSASGGRPPSSAAQQGGSMTFGSFGGGDVEVSNNLASAHTHLSSLSALNSLMNESTIMLTMTHQRPHMRTASSSQDPSALGPQHSPHLRRGSNVSDVSNQAGPPPGNMGGRGGYPGTGRGRGFNNSYNQPAGYPPNNYRGPQGNQARGGMAPNFGNGRPPHQFGTPPPQNRSPAMQQAMPQHPNMPPTHMPPFYYAPPHTGPHQVPPQVFTPSIPSMTNYQRSTKTKKRGGRRDSEKYSNQQRQVESVRNNTDFYPSVARHSRRFEHRAGDNLRRGSLSSYDMMEGPPATDSPTFPFPYPHPAGPSGHIDLSPENGNFELLTSEQQFNGGYYEQSMRQPMHGMPYYPQMMNNPGSPIPGYQPTYNGPYNPPGGQPMSRSTSQLSADQRPASSASQAQPPVTQGTPQSQPAQMKPVVAASPQFTRPVRKSAAITIRNAAGEPVDLKNLNVPPSPATASQPSRTPPVASTPTPPPKASTPKPAASTHTRTDSVSNGKSAEEVRNEFKQKMLQAAGSEKGKEDEAAAKAAADKSAAEKAAAEKTAAEKTAADKAATDKAAADKAAADKAAAEKIAADEKTKAEEELKVEQKAKEDAKAADEAKAQQEAKDKAEADAEAAKAASSKKETPKPADPSEDDVEAMIREMEENEKKEEEANARYEAEKAAKKKAADEAKLANAADEDRKLREQEREMERLEEERERKRAAGGSAPSVKEALDQVLSKQPNSKSDNPSTSETVTKLANLSLNDKSASAPGAKPSPGSRGPKPAALNLAPLNTKSVEPPQPSAALQSLKTARLLDVIKTDMYPPGINSPNPAINSAVAKKGTSFKYDPGFLLQFKAVFTEQPSLDFHQQVKSLIGDGERGPASARTPAGGSGRQNSRTGGPGFPGPVMGGFVAPGGRTLPPGTTSQQRFEMASDSKSMPRPAMGSMASFQRPGGSFPGGNQISRTPSTTNMGGGSMPHSPRTNSRRAPSKQNTFNAKSEAQAAKTMPLTAHMKIEGLPTSTTGWKPTSIGKGPQSSNLAQADYMDPAMVQRKVKAALNKMTPEKFDKISDQILDIVAQSKEEADGRTLRQVIQLTFEKATDEAHWASMYAKFCKRMLETMSPEIRDESIKDKNGQVVSGGALFRKYLLNRCQEEFERGWKMQIGAKPEEGEENKTEEAVMLSEDYYKEAAAKRRGLGLIQFIGELYKLQMLTERIMHECVKKLVDYTGVPEEAEVESLSKLLRTIGANLDAADRQGMMDAYFNRIQGMVNLPELPSRLKFMLMDVLDLRKARWVSKEANKGPKTLDEVRAEAEAAAAQKAAEAARGNQRGGPGGRSQYGRNDGRNFSSGFPQPIPNQVGMDDLRRLKGGASRPTGGSLTLGPQSMLGSRSNSGRRLGMNSSLGGRGADDSGGSSRTGTPPVRENQNAFSLLANMDSEHPASPPSTAASPALAKVTPAAGGKEGK
ncbi:Uu.00g082590.m01.CDS01 [Anthostomella pinea]|uniref:Uu.00g082590.m01.CDS01 n=1 Tax=Anthostomella pinea TaxID=933095 RepID=A0AAI8VG03_9PEZI|nr:Uu.00g082590.m01.CDS01 [Anthostomella pinea]